MDREMSETILGVVGMILVGLLLTQVVSCASSEMENASIQMCIDKAGDSSTRTPDEFQLIVFSCQEGLRGKN